MGLGLKEMHADPPYPSFVTLPSVHKVRSTGPSFSIASEASSLYFPARAPVRFGILDTILILVLKLVHGAMREVKWSGFRLRSDITELGSFGVVVLLCCCVMDLR